MGEQQPLVLLLKDGTDDASGKAQIISNINACTEICNILRTTLGPRGCDKLIKGTVTNDGATVMKLLEVEQPAAQTLVDIAQSQDNEVGDGTTSVVVLAVEFLNQAKEMLEAGLAQQVIIAGYREGCNRALKLLDELKCSVEGDRDALINVGATTLSSKLLSSHARFFGEMAVNAVSRIPDDDPSGIGIKKVTGGAMEESQLVDGIAFKKTFSYAGFEQQPKSFKDSPKILALNIELELKAEKDNAEIRLNDPTAYQSIVNAEWTIIYEKLEACVATGAKIILSKLAIGDLATQYFADRDLFCAGRVPEEDLKRVCKATGSKTQTTLSNVADNALGTCETFEERQVGADRFNFFLGCPKAAAATIILRGGAEQFIDEAERSLHDAICAVRRTKKHQAIVPGGGAIEMEISKHLRTSARDIPGKKQWVLINYAKALEIIPQQLSINAGLDCTAIMNSLRYKHAQEDGARFGVDLDNGTIVNTYEKYVWEPVLVKRNAIVAATEAACMILSVDRTVKNPKSEQVQ